MLVVVRPGHKDNLVAANRAMVEVRRGTKVVNHSPRMLKVDHGGARQL